MRSRFLLPWFFFFLVSGLQADLTSPQENQTQCRLTPKDSDFCFLEVRAAYFYPTSNEFRGFYPGGVIWGLEFDCQAMESLYWWLSAEYFRKDGKTNLGSSTNVAVVPLNAGFKWCYTEYWLQPYLGLGIETTYLREKVNSPNLLHSTAFWTFGLRFKSGFFARFYDHFFLDFFADYSLKCANLHKASHSSVTIDSPNTSHFSFGGGLGYAF